MGLHGVRRKRLSLKNTRRSYTSDRNGSLSDTYSSRKVVGSGSAKVKMSLLLFYKNIEPHDVRKT